jgi:hypothetical protein
MPWIRTTPDEAQDMLESGDAIDISWSRSRPRRPPRASGQGPSGTRRYARASDDYDDYGHRSDQTDDGFDGFYDRHGRRMNLVIQTPADMLPPTRRAAELDDRDWPVNRSGYRSRF